MNVIHLRHGEGKTTRLVEFMLEAGNEDVIYVAPTIMQARRIAREYALAMGARLSAVPVHRFISARDIKKGANARYVIDEADGVLNALMGGEVLAIAVTIKETPEERHARWEQETA